MTHLQKNYKKITTNDLNNIHIYHEDQEEDQQIIIHKENGSVLLCGFKLKYLKKEDEQFVFMLCEEGKCEKLFSKIKILIKNNTG